MNQNQDSEFTSEILEGYKKKILRESGLRQDNDDESVIEAEISVTKEDILFVLSTISKEAEFDRLSIKQLFYGMASA